MYGREYFHESVVKDIIDILTDMKDFDEVQFLNNMNSHRSFKSITSATKDLILTFPVMVSSDLDPETALMFAKAHEKKCASLLHILFTAICVDNSEDIYDYVRKFHANVGSLNGSFEDYANAFDKLAATYENYDQTLKIDKEVLNAVLEDLKESNYTLPDDLAETSLDEYKIIPGYRTGYNDMIVHEAQGTGGSAPKPNITNTFDGYSANVKGDQHSYGYGNSGTQTITIDHSSNKTYLGSDKEHDHDSLSSKDLKDYADYANKRVLDSEYKKANEMQPTLMVVNFVDSESKRSIQAVIGVKAKIYTVSSADIINRVDRKLKDKNVLTNFVRATTNEIGFFRDFLFAIDNAKFDAKAYGRSQESNKLWKILERRSKKSKFRRSLKMYNDATAITSLVLSENDVEYLKKTKNIDMMNVGQVRKLLDAYNFMCIAIMNESTEVASIIYDTGEDSFETLTFNGLEREASDNSYKKMVNLLTKVNR